LFIDNLGAYCRNKQLAIPLAAAAWCLACFVLVQAYSSTLIASITSPNNKPIINSINDFPNVPDLKMIVNRNLGADLLFQASRFAKWNSLQFFIIIYYFFSKVISVFLRNLAIH
jgi:hypothetical protein